MSFNVTKRKINTKKYKKYKVLVKNYVFVCSFQNYFVHAYDMSFHIPFLRESSRAHFTLVFFRYTTFIVHMTLQKHLPLFTFVTATTIIGTHGGIKFARIIYDIGRLRLANNICNQLIYCIID